MFACLYFSIVFQVSFWCTLSAELATDEYPQPCLPLWAPLGSTNMELIWCYQNAGLADIWQSSDAMPRDQIPEDALQIYWSSSQKLSLSTMTSGRQDMKSAVRIAYLTCCINLSLSHEQAGLCIYTRNCTAFIPYLIEFSPIISGNNWDYTLQSLTETKFCSKHQQGFLSS